MKQKLPYILVGLLLVAGLGILFYPAVSNLYNEKYQIQAVIEHDDTVKQLSGQAVEYELERAQQYNEALTGQGIEDPFIPGSGMILPENYTSILNINNGIMGSILIPEIDVNLSIYHGTGEDALHKGIGHMEMTPFPIGGPGSHSVLTGHTGLPDTTLFTNLDKLKPGSYFYIKILGNILAYQVDQIFIVEPSETDELRPVPGKDYVSLVTCTPYAINSHRLLVRGTRVPYEAAVAGELQTYLDTDTKMPAFTFDLIIALVVLAVVCVVFIGMVISRRKRKKQRKLRSRYYTGRHKNGK